VVSRASKPGLLRQRVSQPAAPLVDEQAASSMLRRPREVVPALLADDD